MAGIKTDIVVKQIPEGMSGTGRKHKRKNYGKKRLSRNPTQKVIRKSGGVVKKAGGGMTRQGLYPAEEARSGTMSEAKRKSSPIVKRKLSGDTKPPKKKKKSNKNKKVAGITGGIIKGVKKVIGETLDGVPIQKIPEGKSGITGKIHKRKNYEKPLAPRRDKHKKLINKTGGVIGRKHSGTLLVASTYTGIPK
jgi:hypothetical protein